jgi:Protein of unknown function (DUF1501)
MSTSRRGFLKRAMLGAAALGVTRVPGIGGLGRAEAALPGDDKPAVFILNLIGGYNALFPSADSFVGTGAFGVTAANIRRIGTSDLYVDRATLGTLSATTLNKMAAIGVNHGISAHPTARTSLLLEGNASRLVKLSGALPGTAAVRCVVVGNTMPEGIHRAVGDISLQQVRDLSTTIAALGGSTSASAPERGPAADGILAAQAMSKPTLDKNPTSARTLVEGFPAAAAQLKQDTVAFNYANIAAAYGITPGTGGTLPTATNNEPMQIMGAELMIRAGANVVIANTGGWDTHGDNNGSVVRTKLTAEGTMAALKVFTDRTLAMTDRNVVTVIIGDFSRSLPGSNHQANLTATVIGKHVQLGTTGRVNADVGLPQGSPGIQGLWAYLSAVTGVTTNPFGTNPHGLVIA